MIVRLEATEDVAAIRAVEEAAFPTTAEAGLVDDLRSAGDAVFSLVACEEGKIVGHAMFSKLNAPVPALALGPVAVSPARQKSGIGSLLIRDGLARGETDGWVGIFVLGNPKYYNRFGFFAETAKGLETPYSGPNFMALPLGRTDLPVRSGRIDMHGLSRRSDSVVNPAC